MAIHRFSCVYTCLECTLILMTLVFYAIIRSSTATIFSRRFTSLRCCDLITQIRTEYSLSLNSLVFKWYSVQVQEVLHGINTDNLLFNALCKCVYCVTDSSDMQSTLNNNFYFLGWYPQVHTKSLTCYWINRLVKQVINELNAAYIDF